MPLEENRATATGHIHKKCREVRLCSFWVMRVDRQTDILITILCNPTRMK